MNSASGADEIDAELEQVGDDDDTDQDCDYETEIASIENIAEAAELDPDVGIILPPHHPCSSHTLSLIAMNDSQSFKGKCNIQ